MPIKHPACEPCQHSRFRHLHARFILLRRSNRPQLLQNMIDMRKRLKGAPVSGTISIVVTDIEDFSGLSFYAHYYAALCCQRDPRVWGERTHYPIILAPPQNPES